LKDESGTLPELSNIFQRAEVSQVWQAGSICQIQEIGFFIGKTAMGSTAPRLEASRKRDVKLC
jgi:hypothetical protein